MTDGKVVRGEFLESYPIVKISRKREISFPETELKTLERAFYTASIIDNPERRPGIDLKYPKLSARAFYTCGTPDGTNDRYLLPLNHETTVAIGLEGGRHRILFRNGNQVAGIPPSVYGINSESQDDDFVTFEVSYLNSLSSDVFLAAAGLDPDDYKGDRKAFEAHVKRMQDLHDAVRGVKHGS